MRYEDPVVNKFWRIGYKMFHGKWIRFMSGPKSRGELINNITSPGNFDPTQSRINFSVPFAKVKSTSESPVPASQVKPGILTHLLDKFSELIWNDVKKIDKKEILKEISNSNVLSVTDIQSLAENVSIGKTIKTVTAKDFHHTSQFSKVADVLVNSYSVGNIKDDRKFNVSARINHMTATKTKSKAQLNYSKK
jgi:hypothetical protein